ncbi:ATP-binding protein [Pseudothermotoga sp. U03pept]|uniref:ATP-binding protein n=1 Tax=Pseudothermotoga sp. U03pept TaxID=3447012 RepID=UPI003F0F002D
MKEIVTISFSSKSVNTRLARAVIRSFLTNRNLPDEAIWDTELGVNEALTNIIRHTYKNDERRYITMTLIWNEPEKELQILLRDFGEPIDASVMIPKVPSPEREGGFGLYIIHKIFDTVELKNLENGNLLKVIKVFEK